MNQKPPPQADPRLLCAGSYKGCEHQLTYHTTREVTLDPLSTTVMTPYEVRAQPGVSWQADDNDVFTLMLYDAGYMSVNALHLNIPGSNLTEGQVVCPHTRARACTWHTQSVTLRRSYFDFCNDFFFNELSNRYVFDTHLLFHKVSVL